jgi:tetratricopeptide (TPR) repeat protein
MALNSQEIVAQKLRSLIDQNLVLPVDNDFQLAAPIRSAVNSLKGFFSADEHARLASRLKASHWQQPHNELPPFEIINATVNAVLRSANINTELDEFGSLVMPSVMYRVAKEHYDSGGEKGWEAAQQLLKRILDLVPTHKASLILLFKTYVRLNQWQFAEDVLNKIDAERFIDRHYLRGFLLWKKRETAQAVSHFRNAMALGHHAVEVYHGLASALYELENLEEAEKVLKKGLEGRRRPNFLLWDLAAKIAILREQYQKAEEIIDELKRLGEDEDYHHRVATLYSAQKKISHALFHARKAASGKRTRFEVRAHLADILVELSEFKEALEHIDSLDESYRIGTLRHDVRVGLRCKLNLRMRNWKAAEQLWHELHVRDFPVQRALRAEILRQKIDDHATTPGQRANAEEELESLGVQQLLFGLFESPDVDSDVGDEVENS